MEDASDGYAQREGATASEKKLAWGQDGRDCRAIPFLSGTEFRDGSACACAELCKPSPCNITISKNFGYEIAMCGTRLFHSGARSLFRTAAIEMRALSRGLKSGSAE
jgi:hypothetical protein